MKKKLPSAKLPLPEFRSDKEAAEYFDTRSIADIWDQLPPAKPAKLSAALSKSIRECHAAAKSPFRFALLLNRLRPRRGLPRRNRSVIKRKLRMWIAEAIQRGAKRPGSASRGR
jgi:hypothetical protein